MFESRAQRQLGGMSVFWVIASGVPLVSTLLLAEWAGIDRVLAVAFLPFIINGIVGFALISWSSLLGHPGGEPNSVPNAE